MTCQTATERGGDCFRADLIGVMRWARGSVIGRLPLTFDALVIATGASQTVSMSRADSLTVAAGASVTTAHTIKVFAASDTLDFKGVAFAAGDTGAHKSIDFTLADDAARGIQLRDAPAESDYFNGEKTPELLWLNATSKAISDGLLTNGAISAAHPAGGPMLHPSGWT